MDLNLTVTKEIFVLDLNTSVFIKCKPTMTMNKIYELCCERHGLDIKLHYLSFNKTPIINPPVRVQDFDPETRFIIKRETR